MQPNRAKRNGVHYTPPELARFLADVTARHIDPSGGVLRILDPACGDGALLSAVAEALPARCRGQVVLTGYETDADAIERARVRLGGSGVSQLILHARDFLATGDEAGHYDVVIANPPYVRTQVLGAEKAQALARRFGLTGRVDLYQAFTKAAANVLEPGGVLGLLTSNRFLTIKAGEALRRLLRTEFDLQAVYDLGDTKLFSAAVLPAIVVATKRNGSLKRNECSFIRVYAHGSGETGASARQQDVFEVLRDPQTQGIITTHLGRFHIERGALAPAENAGDVWTLSTPAYDDWLQAVRSHQACRFQDVAHIKVGIKTTADSVFVRDDWDQLPDEIRPEPSLLHPLITHRDAARWNLNLKWSQTCRRVLYPHETNGGCRTPIDLVRYPRAKRYLLSHEQRLKRRKYVIEAGRRWYEVWVPHDPADWAKPKLVYPDIAETPRFAYDDSGAIVQGDCYWITLRDDMDPDWLLLMLAVANSTFITRYYDLAFHNKLYAGRRRFMTQYVKTFPLPPLKSATAREIVALVRHFLTSGTMDESAERAVDALVWRIFGFNCDLVGQAEPDRPD